MARDSTPPVTETGGGLTFLSLSSGALSIGHRPALRKLKGLRKAGVTHLVTVLCAAEDAALIGDAARGVGLEWIWIDLGSTKNLPVRCKPQVRNSLTEMTEILHAGGRIFLHCSAGIHRTGMITAALLFTLGLSEAQVRAALAVLRPLTEQEMGDARFEWARSFSDDLAT